MKRMNISNMHMAFKMLTRSVQRYFSKIQKKKLFISRLGAYNEA
jgi:hypothetical protein